MIQLKQLQQSGNPIYPVTVAEGVLVKSKGKVELLQPVLNRKIELIQSEDLTITKNGPELVIEHANKIDANESPQLLLIQHDAHGHIVRTESAKPLIINVNKVEYKLITPLETGTVDFGDDFTVNEENQISLHWNEIK